MPLKFHCHCSQCDSQIATQPQLPEASDSIRSTSWVGSCKIPTPFQVSMKVCHQSRSDLTCAFSLINLSLSRTDVMTSMIRLTNLLPGLTIFAACCSSPSSDSSSRLHPAFLPIHFPSSPRILLSLSSGNLSSMAKESISIPRYVIVVAGPSHFSWATKTPNWSHMFIKQDLLCSHYATYLPTSVKILGADHRPKGKQVSM